MAFNSPNEIIPGNGSQTASGATKRKASRKSAAAPSNPERSTAKRPAAAGPMEIIFKELPNPYHPPQPPYIWIDHPQQAERLLEPVYVVRLGVGGAESVWISIDGEPWRACRFTSGYWWYDWTAIPTGKRTLVARMKTTDGRWFKTPTRNCEYRR